MDGQERTRRLGELEQRYVWDPLDKYLGPTGVPDRLRGLMTLAGEVAPSTAIMRSMQGAGRAADSGLPADERARAGLESLVEAGTVVVPSAIAARAANLSRASRGMRPSSSAAAQGLDEAVLGVGAVRDAQQEIFDQGRRNFLRGAGAAVLATRLPSEDLLADTGRYLDELARPATRLLDLAPSIIRSGVAADRTLMEAAVSRGIEGAGIRTQSAIEIAGDLSRLGDVSPDDVAALSDTELLGLSRFLRRTADRMFPRERVGVPEGDESLFDPVAEIGRALPPEQFERIDAAAQAVSAEIGRRKLGGVVARPEFFDEYLLQAAEPGSAAQFLSEEP